MLDALRKEIDDADEILLKAFLKRMEISKQIALYKKENQLPIENLQREAEVLKKRKAEAKDLGNYAEEFFKFLIEESKKLQKNIVN